MTAQERGDAGAERRRLYFKPWELFMKWLQNRGENRLAFFDISQISKSDTKNKLRYLSIKRGNNCYVRLLFCCCLFVEI